MAKRIALVVAGVLGLLVAVQLIVPRIAEREVEGDLTDGGGTAEVSMSAFPAPRLLWNHGYSIEVTGTGLDLDLPEGEPAVFERLDGFKRVDLSLTDFRAGPFDVQSFELHRDGSGPYDLRSHASLSAADIATYGAERLDLAGASLARVALAQILPGIEQPVSVDLDMEIQSEDGRISVVSGGGTIAGVPTGPLAELITSAIAVRL